MKNQQEPVILAFDTATTACTVSLTTGGIEDGKVIASRQFCGSITHSRRLLVVIDEILQESGLKWEQLAGLAIGLGPGSFTGLRIGLSTAKGLAASSSLPLMGVSTLAGLAAGCTGSRLICAVIDARKKEVYSAFYRFDKRGGLIQQGEITASAPEKLAESIRESVLLVGDGVFACGGLWWKKLGDLVRLAPPGLHQPNAANIGFLAWQHYQEQNFLDLAEASPLYVRASDAELNLGKKMKEGR
ncbi:MAG: tRNA (adenosine(37)-N6)-threonylcarbamoyltransferase complex dimerization subunit type 1 TsaB [Deltaproteobacteria bacterium]|nr:MAG: tRNA (adenosine(37)-N6)-threonylcarbamoyltransferase complex dimerization subunit type 1 TsaB [Deltaproteobacteria bacterium]